MVSESDRHSQIPAKRSFSQLISSQRISLTAINSEDKTYCITTDTDIGALAASIQQLGLIHPPVLKHLRSEYIIISGFRRIAACRQLGWSEISASVLSPDVDNATCARYAIADNSYQRPLNIVEISRSFLLLSANVSDKTRQLMYASDLGLPAHRDHIKKIEKICRLPERIQEAILNGTISLAIALELLKFETDIAIDLVKLFDQLKIGVNKQRELILMFDEIALREKIPLHALLNEGDVRQILDDAELDRVQKGHRIKQYLRSRRFPTISGMTKKFENLVSTLELGDSVKLIPPKDFEGTTYTLTLQFRNHSELSELQSKLDNIIRNRDLKKFLLE